MRRHCELCVLQNALNLFNTEAVWTSAAVLNCKFSPEKRKYLTLCTMLANEADDIIELTDAALKGLSFGVPLPPFSSPMEDANWWSERASLSERKAYLVACYSSLSKRFQQDFIDFAVERSDQ